MKRGGGWWQRLGNREKKDFFFEPLLRILSSYLSGAVVCFSSLTDQPTSIDLFENFTCKYRTQTMGAQRRASATWPPPCVFFFLLKSNPVPPGAQLFQDCLQKGKYAGLILTLSLSFAEMVKYSPENSPNGPRTCIIQKPVNYKEFKESK